MTVAHTSKLLGFAIVLTGLTATVTGCQFSVDFGRKGPPAGGGGFHPGRGIAAPSHTQWGICGPAGGKWGVSGPAHPHWGIAGGTGTPAAPAPGMAGVFPQAQPTPQMNGYPQGNGGNAENLPMPMNQNQSPVPANDAVIPPGGGLGSVNPYQPNQMNPYQPNPGYGATPPNGNTYVPVSPEAGYVPNFQPPQPTPPSANAPAQQPRLEPSPGDLPMPELIPMPDPQPRSSQISQDPGGLSSLMNLFKSPADHLP